MSAHEEGGVVGTTHAARYPEDLRSRSLFLTWGPPSHGPRTKVFARTLGIDAVFVHATKRRGALIAPWKYAYQAVATPLVLWRRRPFVVFVQSPPSLAPLVVWLYTAVAGGRFIVDAHSGAFDSRIWTKPAWLHRFIARRAAATVVTNEHHRDLLSARGARGIIIRDVPTTFELGASPPVTDGFKVMVVATFAPDEPIHELVAAATDLPDVSFYVTGDPSRPGFVAPATIPPNVHFTGFIPDDEYFGLMRASDAVLCLTTREHTMQRGACEALSMGVPIITSDTALLRTYFRMGTVHVANDRAGIRAGVARMVTDHERFVGEIRHLQHLQREEWEASLSELVGLVRS